MSEQYVLGDFTTTLYMSHVFAWEMDGAANANKGEMSNRSTNLEAKLFKLHNFRRLDKMALTLSRSHLMK